MVMPVRTGVYPRIAGLPALLGDTVSYQLSRTIPALGAKEFILFLISFGCFTCLVVQTV